MLYLLYIEVSADVGIRLEFEEGGPAKILGHLVERFSPRGGVHSGRHACLPDGGRPQ